MPPPPAATRSQLLYLARVAAGRAYCPYSHFRVGAAVLAGGRFFTGGNVENASYGLTVCAERVAAFTAAAAGFPRLSAVAVSCVDAPKDGPREGLMPCGACRQVLAEFGGPELIAIVDGVGDFTLKELLPSAFVLKRPAVAEQVIRTRPRLLVTPDAFGDESSPEFANAFGRLAAVFDTPQVSLDVPFAAVGTDTARAPSYARAGVHSFVLGSPPAVPAPDDMVHYFDDWATLADALLGLASRSAAASEPTPGVRDP